jgi:hypothetical protein
MSYLNPLSNFSFLRKPKFYNINYTNYLLNYQYWKFMSCAFIVPIYIKLTDIVKKADELGRIESSQVLKTITNRH